MATKPPTGLLVGPVEYEEDKEPGAGKEAKHAAAAAAMKAFKSGDVDALNDAMTAHYKACAMGE